MTDPGNKYLPSIWSGVLVGLSIVTCYGTLSTGCFTRPDRYTAQYTRGNLGRPDHHPGLGCGWRCST